MAIYQELNGKLIPFETTTFANAGYRERADLQRLLKQQIEIIAPDTLIISEEFGEWEDSRRRIDLLGIDKSANLVVIELKRTEDGGHMELQAIRYAAMVSTLTFDAAVQAFQQYITSAEAIVDARERILEFLDWEQPDDDQFAQDVRIVLAAAEFSREITSSVLWLNDHGLDIRCVRLKPYKDADRLLIDVQQVIPLPETEDYQIRIREKKVLERERMRVQDRDFTRYDITAGSATFSHLPKRRAIYHVIRHLCDEGVDPDAIRDVFLGYGNALLFVEGELDAEAFEKAIAIQLMAQNKKTNFRRYFIADDELIRANGKTFAVTKMWGSGTIEWIDALLKRFPGHEIYYKESV